jgi:hypothetical protein
MFDLHRLMSSSPDRPTQKTRPKGKGKPTDIPVPTREDVFKVFEKVAKTPDPDAKPEKPSDAGGAEK